MELLKYTGPILAVASVQLIFGACRIALGDFTGAATGGALAIMGFFLVYEIAALSALVYGGACGMVFLYDLVVSARSLGSQELQRLLTNGLITELLACVVLLAPLVSLAGALLALRLHRHLADCCEGELLSLKEQMAKDREAEPVKPHYRSATTLWPPQTVKYSTRGRQPSPPFRAIMSTPLPEGRTHGAGFAS